MKIETTVGFEVKDDGIQMNATMSLDDAKALNRLMSKHHDDAELSGDLGVFHGTLGAAIEIDLPEVVDNFASTLKSPD